MRQVLLILSLGLVAACGSRPENKSSPTPATDSSAPKVVTQAVAESASAVAQDSKLAEPFDRISIPRIDSALLAFDAGDTVSIDSFDINECIGTSLNHYVMSKGLRLEGNAYSLYATIWTFSGAFQPVMGLRPGLSRPGVLGLLGRPAQQWADSLQYLSDKPDGYEHDYFEARWYITVRFELGMLKSLTFTPQFDDC